MFGLCRLERCMFHSLFCSGLLVRVMFPFAVVCYWHVLWLSVCVCVCMGVVFFFCLTLFSFVLGYVCVCVLL